MNDFHLAIDYHWYLRVLFSVNYQQVHRRATKIRRTRRTTTWSTMVIQATLAQRPYHEECRWPQQLPQRIPCLVRAVPRRTCTRPTVSTTSYLSRAPASSQRGTGRRASTETAQARLQVCPRVDPRGLSVHLVCSSSRGREDISRVWEVTVRPVATHRPALTYLAVLPSPLLARQVGLFSALISAYLANFLPNEK